MIRRPLPASAGLLLSGGLLPPVWKRPASGSGDGTVAAAAQLLHHYLYIDLVNGTGAEINGIIVIGENHGSFYSLDLKEFISRLAPVIVGLSSPSAGHTLMANASIYTSAARTASALA